jgi:hypothetical protein
MGEDALAIADDLATLDDLAIADALARADDLSTADALYPSKKLCNTGERDGIA